MRCWERADRLRRLLPGGWFSSVPLGGPQRGRPCRTSPKKNPNQGQRIVERNGEIDGARRQTSGWLPRKLLHVPALALGLAPPQRESHEGRTSFGPGFASLPPISRPTPGHCRCYSRDRLGRRGEGGVGKSQVLRGTEHSSAAGRRHPLEEAWTYNPHMAPIKVPLVGALDGVPPLRHIPRCYLGPGSEIGGRTGGRERVLSSSVCRGFRSHRTLESEREREGTKRRFDGIYEDRAFAALASPRFAADAIYLVSRRLRPVAELLD